MALDPGINLLAPVMEKGQLCVVGNKYMYRPGLCKGSVPQWLPAGADTASREHFWGAGQHRQRGVSAIVTYSVKGAVELFTIYPISPAVWTQPGQSINRAKVGKFSLTCMMQIDS